MRKKRDSHGVPTYSKKFGNTGKNKSKSQHSIMHKHQIRLLDFQNREDRIRTLDNKIKHLETSLKKQKENKSTNLDNVRSNELRLEELILEKKSLQSNVDELDYLLESSIIIKEYMDLEMEESVLLNIKDLNLEENQELNDIQTRKKTLVDMYLTKFEPNYCNQKNEIRYESIHCNDCNVNFITEQSFLVCPSCGKCFQTVEQSADLSYKELQDFDYRPQFTYDKMTHLEDWLRRFQAKENRTIPQEILDKVLLEANKERVQDLNTLTEDKIKRYLKKLNLNDYYDNVIGIINRINGRPPFTLTSEIEEKIKIMFQQIQEPYEKFKPSGRKNFLSYSYTLHKFFQILGLHEFAKYFPLLKSTDKLRQQDDIFKKIVGYMSQTDPSTKWVFYPSI
jgi:hypothetical protein